MAKGIRSDSISTFDNDDEVKDWLEEFEVLKIESKKDVTIRPISAMYVYGRHWPKSMRKGGTKSCPPMWCTQYDMEKQKWDTTRPCPMHDDFEDKAQRVFVMAAIVRNYQTGKKAKDNPIAVVVLPGSVAKALVTILSINKCDIADVEKGCDILISYDAEQAGTAKWQLQRVDRTPLTEEERELLETSMPDLEGATPDYGDPNVAAEYAKQCKAKMARWGYYVTPLNNGKKGWDAYKNALDGKPYVKFPDIANTGKKNAGDDEAPRARNSRDDDDGGGRSSSRRQRDDEPDPDMPARRRPADDDDTPPPSNKKGGKPVNRDDDDAQEQKPAASKKPRPAPPPADDDEGTVEESEDADAAVEEAPPPPSKKPSSKKPVPSEADADETSEETPPKKEETAQAATGAAKGPKAHREWSEHFKILWEEKDESGMVPSCFGSFEGAAKCRQCPKRSGCLAAEG